VCSMKEKMIQLLTEKGPITVAEICDYLSLVIAEVHALLSELLKEQAIQVVMIPNEFGCIGCPCGRCAPIPARYDIKPTFSS